MQYMGYDVIKSFHMVETVYDWSKCRSPSRAKRRMKKHPQHVVITTVPRKDILFIESQRLMVCHPATYDAIIKELDRCSIPNKSPPLKGLEPPLRMRPFYSPWLLSSPSLLSPRIQSGDLT